jgi:hypothetical protein
MIQRASYLKQLQQWIDKPLVKILKEYLIKGYAIKSRMDLL